MAEIAKQLHRPAIRVPLLKKKPRHVEFLQAFAPVADFKEPHNQGANNAGSGPPIWTIFGPLARNGFLLDREPKESILEHFDVTVISRYFREFEQSCQVISRNPNFGRHSGSGAALAEDDMAGKFRALLMTKDGDRQSVTVTELTDADLMEGDVTVAVEHSTVNYKDGLAITGKAPIIRKFTLIPGIDLAGKVLRSEDPRFQAGDRVVLNGYGLGEVHHGGYAERARVKGDWLIRLPENISTADAMAIGTAGYTAMLCVLALEKAGITADRGDVLVTGAAGGVGSVAIALLDKLGYRVVASSRRGEQEGDYLRGLGADEIIDAGELSGAGVPLDKERWAGAVDSLGSRTLANVLSQIKYDGAVAACGLAQGSDLPATVMPFILRNVTLAGINSVVTLREKREEAWGRLATDLDLATLNSMTSRARLDDVPALATKILAGKTRGRVVIDL